MCSVKEKNGCVHGSLEDEDEAEARRAMAAASLLPWAVVSSLPPPWLCPPVFLSDILSLPRSPCFQVWDLLQTCREAWDECGCLPARPPSSSEGCGPSPEGTEALCLVSWSRFRAESFLRCRWCRGSCQKGQLGDQRPPLPLAGV